ncbi:hypothetical protein BC831DRAFT_464743 [Entophlyctis helioformis]|nr:hypothetical protein BC831DRAFT_464743 [Entophlyctis helioformis]
MPAETLPLMPSSTVSPRSPLVALSRPSSRSMPMLLFRLACRSGARSLKSEIVLLLQLVRPCIDAMLVACGRCSNTSLVSFNLLQDADGIQVDTPAQAPSPDMDGGVGETHAAAQAAEAAEAVLGAVLKAMPRNSADADEDNGANSVLDKKPAHAPAVGAARAVPNALPKGGVGIGMDEGSDGKVGKGKVMGTDPGGSDDDQEAALAALYAEFLNIDPSQVDKNSSFVELGGDSISAIKAGRKVQRTGHQRNGGSSSWLKEPWTAAGIGCRVWFWRCCLAASQAFVSRLA